MSSIAGGGGGGGAATTADVCVYRHGKTPEFMESENSLFDSDCIQKRGAEKRFSSSACSCISGIEFHILQHTQSLLYTHAFM